jgi:DNA repair exonuclease SbcCD ATPase subunit
MSTQANNASIIYKIARTISATLKLGDAGKLDSFLGRVVKQLEKEIKGLKRALGNEQYNHENRLEVLEDKLADAKVNLENAYLAINMDEIGTNQKEVAYVDVYLENLDDHVGMVKECEQDIEQEKENFAEYAKDNQEKIDSLQVRIDAIGAK